MSPSDDIDLARALLIIEKLRPQLNANDGGAYAVCRDAALEAGFMFHAKRCRRVPIKKSNRPGIAKAWFSHSGARSILNRLELGLWYGQQWLPRPVTDADEPPPRGAIDVVAHPSVPDGEAYLMDNRLVVGGQGPAPQPLQFSRVGEADRVDALMAAGMTRADVQQFDREERERDIVRMRGLAPVADQPGELFGIDAASYELWSGPAWTWKSDLIFVDIKRELAQAAREEKGFLDPDSRVAYRIGAEGLSPRGGFTYAGNQRGARSVVAVIDEHAGFQPGDWLTINGNRHDPADPALLGEHDGYRVVRADARTLLVEQVPRFNTAVIGRPYDSPVILSPAKARRAASRVPAGLQRTRLDGRRR